MFYSIISIALLIIAYLLMKVNRLERKLKELQNPSMLLPKTTDEDIKNDLQKLLKEGQEVKAIKKAREAFGLSLLEGKKYIDSLKLEDK